jgi:hypothetical protein
MGGDSGVEKWEKHNKQQIYRILVELSGFSIGEHRRKVYRGKYTSST